MRQVISPVTAPFSQGFQDGYQTMDLLASLSIGTIVVNAIRMRGTTDNKSVSKICIISGFITVALMTLVYGSLAYIGATSAGVLGHVENGGQLLADAAEVEIAGIANITEGYSNSIYAKTTNSRSVGAMYDLAAESDETSVSGGELTISAQVTASFIIK